MTVAATATPGAPWPTRRPSRRRPRSPTPTPANNSATDTDAIVLPLPTLAVLDDFNRANANTLGANWVQTTRPASPRQQQPGTVRVDIPGSAIWNGAGQCRSAPSRARRSRSPTARSAPSRQSTARLLLKASGDDGQRPPATSVCCYDTGSGGRIVVATTTNTGWLHDDRATFATGTCAIGDILTAVANAATAPWTCGGNTTYVGRSSTAGAALHRHRPDRHAASRQQRPGSTTSAAGPCHEPATSDPPIASRRGSERHERSGGGCCSAGATCSRPAASPPPRSASARRQAVPGCSGASSSRPGPWPSTGRRTSSSSGPTAGSPCRRARRSSRSRSGVTVHPDAYAPDGRTTYIFGFANATGIADVDQFNLKNKAQHNAPAVLGAAKAWSSGSSSRTSAWPSGPTCSTSTPSTGTASRTSSRSSTASRPARSRSPRARHSRTSTCPTTRARTCTTATSRTPSTSTWG